MPDKIHSPMVRQSTPEDLDFVLGLVSRLVAFEAPPWREPRRLVSSAERLLDEAVRSPRADAALIVAEDESGERLSFIHVVTSKDYFSGEMHGYVSELAVAEASGGRGVGRALMEAGEAWARRRGYRTISLDVLAANTSARAFYERLGYGEDLLSLFKELGES